MRPKINEEERERIRQQLRHVIEQRFGPTGMEHFCSHYLGPKLDRQMLNFLYREGRSIGWEKVLRAGKALKVPTAALIEWWIVFHPTHTVPETDIQSVSEKAVREDDLFRRKFLDLKRLRACRVDGFLKQIERAAKK